MSSDAFFVNAVPGDPARADCQVLNVHPSRTMSGTVSIMGWDFQGIPPDEAQVFFSSPLEDVFVAPKVPLFRNLSTASGDLINGIYFCVVTLERARESDHIDPRFIRAIFVTYTRDAAMFLQPYLSSPVR
jgi:hypothetical protein